MKAMKALFQKETWIRGMLGVAAFIMVVSLQTFTSLAASGKVVAETAKIRSEASTSSSVVGSTVKGKTIDIVGAVKDSSGTVWYKVPNGNNTYGYIRSDLVETSDDIKVEAAPAATTAAATEKPADTVPTSIGEQVATIAVESAKIRSGASTSHDPVASLSKGESITLIGEATDSAGKKWYQIRFTKNGSSKEGYIRSDLITMGASSDGAVNTDGSQTDGTDTADADGSEEASADGESTEIPEETDTEEPPEETPAEPEHNDYEVVYNDETYWLYDNVNGTMMSVTNLLDVVNQTGADNEALQKQVTTEKIIIIVMAVIMVILIAAVTILIFKLKDAYYYEDYEDEEDELQEEEPEPPVRKKKKQSRDLDYEEEPVPVKRKRTREREDFYEEEERPVRKKTRQEADLTAAEEKQPVKKTSRKAQNFLVDDDEFEFEFLNMDDKDL